MANNARDEDDGDIDVEAERRLQSFILGLKQQADQLMMGEKFDDAIRLYRGLLVHLTKSQVKMAKQKDLVISCRMNVLGGLSKLEKWPEIPAECEHVFQFLNDIKQDIEKTMTEEQLKAMQAQILGRVFYFRGVALLRLGAFAQADHDFRVAMGMLPDVEAIKEDWKQVQGALYLENRVKELMNTAMEQFQANNFPVAMKACEDALVEATKLQKTDLIALIHGNLAAACARAEQDDAALEHFTKAADLTRQLDPAHWNDRLFDLLESVTSIHMRKNDLEAAYAVLQESLALFPKCKDRQSREHIHFLNIGRVCFALKKFDESLRHLERAEKAADDADGRLQALSWIGKVHLEHKRFEKLDAVVDRALAVTVKEQKDDMHAVFLLLWLAVVEDRAATTSATALSELDVAKLTAAYQFFGHKRLLNGLLRAAQLLVGAWGDDEAHRAKRDEVLNALDAIQIEGLIGGDAELLGRLSLLRVEALVARGAFARAQHAVAHAVNSISVEKSTEHVRFPLLRRLAELCVVAEAEEDEIPSLLEQALAALSGEDTSVAVRSATLVQVAQWKTRNGDVAAAQALLDQSSELLKSYNGENAAELTCQTLVGACVLQLKRGDVEKASELMQQIDGYAFTKEWAVLEAIRQRLSKGNAVEEEEAVTKEKKEVVKKKKKAVVVKAEESVEKEEEKPVEAATTSTAVAKTGLAKWWDENWFAVSVVLVGIVFAYVMTRDEDEQKKAPATP